MNTRLDSIDRETNPMAFLSSLNRVILKNAQRMRADKTLRLTLEALKEAGIRKNVNVLIGGAPVTQQYADEIGADIYAPDGPSAARKAKEALGV